MKVLKTMQNTDFTLEIPPGTPRYLTIGWLGLALASLVIEH